VLELRFGLTDDRPRTLARVGEHFGLTRERIRQIEARVLKRLQHPSRSQLLYDWFPHGTRARIRDLDAAEQAMQQRRDQAQRNKRAAPVNDSVKTARERHGEPAVVSTAAAPRRNWDEIARDVLACVSKGYLDQAEAHRLLSEIEALKAPGAATESARH